MTVPIRPTRAHIDPKLERHRSFLDSLFTLAGGGPDSVVQRRLNLYDVPGASTEGYYNPDTRTLSISPNALDPRRTLAHEAGHVFMHNSPDAFYEFVERVLKQPLRLSKQRGKVPRVAPAQAEPYADAFADALEARTNDKSTNARANFLLNLLPRLTNGSEGAILGTPAAPRPDPRAPALPFLSNLFGER